MGLTPIDILQQTFGYSAFRDGQGELVGSILTGRDALGIMPTGSGKSLCYQIPALAMEGITIVISPLISLMKDQVTALVQSGVRAAYFNSSLTQAQVAEALHRAKNGAYTLIYVAPERLMTSSFLSFAQNADIALLAIDEAHCVSQWGQDFRPDYLHIPEFICRLRKRPIVAAFTATATLEVQQDIVSLLQLHSPCCVTTGFDRPNLYFAVKQPSDKYAALLSIAHQQRDKSGIIYCGTRKAVEEVCARLCDDGFAATRYHAGLDDTERHANQDDFIYDRKPLMVATNAFGMGIDKSNVSFVVHYNMPKNLESYYQEAGRAGRDGEQAQCILLYSGADVQLNEFLIKQSEPNDRLTPEQQQAAKQRDFQRLRDMTNYCLTTECLRNVILQYFGEQPTAPCGNCGTCNTSFTPVNITAEAQKIIDCVGAFNPTNKRFGAMMIAAILHGSKTSRIVQLGLEKHPSFGCLAQVPVPRIRAILSYMVLNGYLEQVGDEYPVLALGSRAVEVEQAAEQLVMKVAADEKQPASAAKKRAKAPIDTPNADLYAILKSLRAKLANEQGVPAYVVFSNVTLMDMCQKLPKTVKAFMTVSGVGEVKCQRYGEVFLRAINGYLDGVK